jgi:hypothetical protein
LGIHHRQPSPPPVIFIANSSCNDFVARRHFSRSKAPNEHQHRSFWSTNCDFW